MLRLDDPHQLWRRYALALGLVVALLGASHWAFVRSLDGGEEAAAVINVSGRQRMLSQRILFLSAEALAREGAEAPDPRLVEAVDLFERSHRALARGGELGLSRAGAARRAPIYAAATEGATLDAMTRSFVADARAVLAGPGPAREAAWTRMREVGPGPLLGRLDGAVHAFEAAARERTARARTISHATFALALAVLAIEAAAIFWPAQRLVGRAVDGLKRSNAALAAARDDAERAARARERFLANMSHELRTPLAGVLGMLELLEDAPLDARAREHAQAARASAGHLLSLLGDVLDLSRIESGHLAIEAVPYDPEGVAAEAVAMLAQAAREKGLAPRLAPEGPLPARVTGDPTRLRQVLVNLLGNAIKFTEGGEVVLTLRHDPGRGGRLGVEVRDTGIGIAPEARARLFGRFEQADASTTRRFGGTGLGLSICRQLVELMGGAIDVESAPGAGSVFRFEIAAPPAAVEDRAPAPDGAEHERPSFRVLVADDNAVNRRVAEGFLRRLGHEVRCVSDGAAAVEAVAAGGVDLVLMDVQMPVLDGVAAARAIRALGGTSAAVPIVALTANAADGDRGTYLDAGMDGCLGKPMRQAELREAIADAMWPARPREEADTAPAPAASPDPRRASA